MVSLLLSRSCYWLSLRQGAILVGIVDLSLMSFLLFILVLGGVHLKEVATMSSEDLQEVEASEQWYLGADLLASPTITNNERKMHLGQHLVTDSKPLGRVGQISSHITKQGHDFDVPFYRLSSTKNSAVALISNWLPLEICRRELKKNLTQTLLDACPYSAKEFMER